MAFKLKSQIAREKKLTSYLYGFDDEHVYIVVDGVEYCHPNSLGKKGLTLPKEYWNKLDELATKLAKEHIKNK